MYYVLIKEKIQKPNTQVLLRVKFSVGFMLKNYGYAFVFIVYLTQPKVTWEEFLFFNFYWILYVFTFQMLSHFLLPLNPHPLLL